MFGADLGKFKGKVWGCDAVIHLDNKADAPTKLSPTGVESIYLGRDVQRNGEYRERRPHRTRMCSIDCCI